MTAVELLGASQGQGNPVNAHRVVAPQFEEPVQRRRFGHVILGMHLEEGQAGRVAAISATCGKRRPIPAQQFGSAGGGGSRRADMTWDRRCQSASGRLSGEICSALRPR